MKVWYFSTIDPYYGSLNCFLNKNPASGRRSPDLRAPRSEASEVPRLGNPAVPSGFWVLGVGFRALGFFRGSM